MKALADVQASVIAALKADVPLVTLLGTSDQIKEVEWQGSDFVYPAVRVETAITPNEVYCNPDGLEIVIYCMSEKKSSRQCSLVADAVAKVFHDKRGYSSAGITFVFSRVTRLPYPKQQEGQSIWTSPVEVAAQVK
jgi:hypothetical protein